MTSYYTMSSINYSSEFFWKLEILVNLPHNPTPTIHSNELLHSGALFLCLLPIGLRRLLRHRIKPHKTGQISTEMIFLSIYTISQIKLVKSRLNEFYAISCLNPSNFNENQSDDYLYQLSKEIEIWYVYEGNTIWVLTYRCPLSCPYRAAWVANVVVRWVAHVRPAG